MRELGVAMSQSAKIFKLKIVLNDVKPLVWRRVLVPADITLSGLHDVIQIVMGWTNGHLHDFYIKNVRYIDRSAHEGHDGDAREERDARLCLVASVGKQFQYTYDLGDCWFHTIIVEDDGVAAPDCVYPVCVAGKNACPPEDVGGVDGYSHFLKAINNSAHREHRAMCKWFGEPDFNSAYFCLDEVNCELRF